MHEKAFEGLAKATTLKRVAPCTFDFGHEDLLGRGDAEKLNAPF
jgi:hypothetical protein